MPLFSTAILPILPLLLLGAEEPAPRTGPTAPPTNGTSIIVGGKPYDVGRSVVLWSDPEGFDGYQKRCIDKTGGCCEVESDRYGRRPGLDKPTLEGLQKIIEAKVAGEEIVTPEAEAPPKVVNLMEALKKSLDAVSTTKKKPAKAEVKVAQPAAKRKRA